MTDAPATLRKTPLHASHLALGARMVPYAGYEMPVQYTSIIEEHRTVRSAVGLFDLSHMGELHLSGPEALAFARYAVVSDPGLLEPGQAQYSMLCAADGGIIDDLIVYRVHDGYLVVCNAANHDAVRAQLESLQAHGDFDVTLADRSEETALIAPQGPRAAELMGRLTDVDLGSLGNYRSIAGRVAGTECLVARTGYTGEDGFELFCAARRAPRLWDALMSTGADLGLKPCGLGSRDTLRLEAGMPLYGNELDRSVEPVRGEPGPGGEDGEGRVRRSLRPGRGAADRAAAKAGRAASCATRPSRATATRSSSTGRRRARSPAGRCRRRSASGSRWPICRRRPPPSAARSRCSCATAPTPPSR